VTFADDVAQWLGASAPSPAVVAATEAVEVWIARMRPDLDLGDPPDVTAAPADVQLGCRILAARLVARQSTPVGQAPGFDGGNGLILRSDSDVERLCGVGRARKPGGVG
jgi:hypothetical protein